VGKGAPTGVACSVGGPTSSFARGESVHWAARLRSSLAAASDAEVALFLDGSQVFRRPLQLQGSGSECLAGGDPLTGLRAGSYRLELYIDGGLEAEGEFTVRP
jgi:hypothetical protein